MDRSASLVLLVAAALAASPAAAGDLEVAKRRDIEEILRIQRWNPGPDKLPEFLRALRLAYPQVPESEWAGAEQVVREVPDPTERMIALHDRLYTAEEIRQILALYRSPFGQKLLAGSALTATEGFVGKQEYLVEVGNRIALELQARGYEPRQVDPPPAEEPPPAAAGEGRLTIDENGWVRPRYAQPRR